MINLIGILVLLILEASLVASIVVFCMHKVNITDEDILSRDRELGKRTQEKREKNATILKLVKRVEELENENKRLRKELKRENSKRL